MMRWNVTTPALLLRCEAAATLAVAVTLYGARGGSWLLFLVLLLAPDLSALGYLVNTATGAAVYNTAHTYVGPVALGAVGLTAGHPWATWGALIWAAHIGMDRVLGYGLKEADAFTHTHLGGRPAGGARQKPGAAIMMKDDTLDRAPRTETAREQVHRGPPCV